MLRWFYLSIGCLVVSMVIFSETVHRTGREPAALVGSLEAPPEITLPRLSLPDARPPVLVFLVRTPESVASVRDAVARERLVADLPMGFAVKEGRIVATGTDAAGIVLTAAGWDDRDLELFQPAPQLPVFSNGKKAPGMAGLTKKSHLTQAEAMAVINALN